MLTAIHKNTGSKVLAGAVEKADGRHSDARLASIDDWEHFYNWIPNRINLVCWRDLSDQAITNK